MNEGRANTTLKCKTLAVKMHMTENFNINIKIKKYMSKLTPWNRVLLEKLTGPQPVQKFLSFYRNCTHKCPPRVPVLSQTNPVQVCSSQLLKIHFNIIFPSTPRSSKQSLSIIFPAKPLHAPLLSPIRATCSGHHIILDKNMSFWFETSFYSLLRSGVIQHFQIHLTKWWLFVQKIKKKCK